MRVEYKSQPLKQNWDKELPRYWFDDSPLKTHFFNALSIVIPPSEHLVIHTIKETQKLLTDQALKEQISEMIAQENWHSFSHRKYNQWLTRIGLPAPELSVDFTQSMVRGKKRWEKLFGQKVWLIITVSGEHNAAVLMEYFLERPKLLAQMHPHFRQAWVWHSIEELEHKGSSMDMWHDTAHIYGYKRWRLQGAYIAFLVKFYWYITKYMCILLSHDKELWKWRTAKDAWNLFLGWDGLITKSIKPLLSFFKPNFHPWDHDSRYLIDQYAKIAEEDQISPEQMQQIDGEFKGCVADIEEIIRVNNVKSY